MQPVAARYTGLYLLFDMDKITCSLPIGTIADVSVSGLFEEATTSHFFLYTHSYFDGFPKYTSLNLPP